MVISPDVSIFAQRNQLRLTADAGGWNVSEIPVWNSTRY